MSAETITTIGALIVGAIVLVILSFSAIIFWSAWQKGARRKHGGISVQKGGRAQARPGKKRKK